MDRERKQAIFSLSVLGIIILGFVFWFIWGNYLDKGTVLITAQEPFSVEITQGGFVDCPTSPCEIKIKSGPQSLLIKKEGFKSKLVDLDVMRWETVTANVDLEVVPYVVETDIYPEVQKKNYELVYNQQNGSFKLVDSNDANKRDIVYFQKEIKSPKIFGSEKAVLIIDESAPIFTAYRINLETKERVKVEDQNLIITIRSGEWSFSGDYFAFTAADSNNIWLLNKENNISALDLTADIKQTAWTYNDKLIFATKQKVEAGKISAEESEKYSIGIYYPVEKNYALLMDLSTITEQAPINLISLTSGNEVYFQAGNKNYKLILK